MPTYTMINNATGEERDMLLSLSEREDFLSTGEWTQALSTAKFITQHGSTLSKTPDSWKEHLRNVKKGAGRRSTINT